MSETSIQTVNDNREKVITQIISALSYNPQGGTMDELRRIILKYAEIERNRVFQDVLAIPITIHTSLADYCAKVRDLAEQPYNAI